MKKTLVFVFILIAVFPAFSVSYKSNVLFQHVAEDTDTPYVLVSDGNTESLYKDDVLVKERITSFDYSFDSVIKTVSIIDYSDNYNELLSYSNGLLTEYSYTGDDSSYRRIYNYDDDGLLLFSSYIEGDREDVEFYIRDSVTGKLLGTKDLNSYSWNGDKYLSVDELIYTEIAEGLYLEDNFTLEEGVIKYRKNDIDYTYSSDGLLLSETSKNSSIEYIYENSVLVSSVEISGDVKTVSRYMNDKVSYSESYQNDVLVETVDYLQSGMIKTLYSNNIKVADVCYDRNNIKVVDIRYYN